MNFAINKYKIYENEIFFLFFWTQPVFPVLAVNQNILIA